MKVAVIFDDVDARPAATPDERGVLDAVHAVMQALRELDHVPVPLGVGARFADWFLELRGADVDVVYNLCEGADGQSAFEMHVGALVELLALPMTGSPADVLGFARRKDRVNATLQAAGLPVPAWQRIDAAGAMPRWSLFPAIVKPAGEDASVGIGQASVVRDAAELADAVSRGRQHGTLIVQEYLGGRELNAGLLGERVLPVAEIDFGALPAGAWPIVSYRAKWETGSDEDLGTRPVCPAVLDDATAACAARLAALAWRTIGGRGYGRVDLRARDDGSLFVLEVNPNPDLAPAAGFARMAAADGCAYVEMVDRILGEALA